VVRGSVRKLSHKKTNHPLLARVFCLFVCLFPLSLLFLTKRKASDYSKKKPSRSFGLSATSQQYFSLRTNQPPATSQQYFSLKTNQHQPSATSQTNRLNI
jgi:hypothetical protein